jgi:hypothetical protein
VHSLDGVTTTDFIEHESGLYLHDASKQKVNTVSYSCLQTVANNKSNFTVRQVEAADAARTLYRLIGHPGYTCFILSLKENHILNCPVTIDDACWAELIYGKDIAFLKGKTTASAAKPHVDDFIPTELPPDILYMHPNVTLCTDLFYVLGLGFGITTSRNIHYLSCHPIADRTKANLRNYLEHDIKLYRQRGFTPTEIHADGEFNCLHSAFPDIHFTICLADDHVREIERAIRTIKEYIRTAIHGMPYARLPQVLVTELAVASIRNINMFPHPDGISTSMLPATIVTGVPKTDYRTLKLEFGTYVQVYDGTSNDTRSRTLGAIATNPTGNTSGDYFFMSLATGKRIHHRAWTVIPISDSVISRVEAIAFNENMPLVDTDTLLSEYDPDATVDDDAYDRTYTPPASDNPDSDHNLTTDAYTDESSNDDDDDDDTSTDDNGHHPNFDDDDNAITIAPTVILPGANEEQTTTAPDGIATVPIANEERLDATENEERIATVPIANEERLDTTENEERMDTTVPCASVTRPTGLRPKQPANYTYRYGFLQSHSNASPTAHSWQLAWNAIHSTPPAPHSTSPSTQSSIHKAITGLMFMQMLAHKGIKKHGTLALNALRKEFLQFKALDVLEPLDAFKLSDDQKSESLRALSVIKEKRDGSLKGRTCADGSKQHGKYSQAETGSPTISNDALFKSIMIDAYERRDVATADIAGAYLHALMKDFITMRFVSWAVDLLCEVNPEYTKYVVYEGKVKVLYTRSVLLGEAHCSILYHPKPPSGERVESKNDPNGSKIEMMSLDPNPVPSYPFTNNTGTDINPSNTNVNVNTSHSIEKYPEV